jgi:DNA-binding PadR family transcriptional regulator
MSSISKKLMGVSAIPMVLSILKKGDSYGYEIVQTVKKITNNGITWKEASIYPVLKRLEREGMIKSYWKMRRDEQPRKYYSLLPEGEKKLAKNRHELEMVYSVYQAFWD